MKNDILISKLGVVLLCAALVTACSSNTDTTTPTEDNTSTVETTVKSTDTSNVQQASVKLSDLVTFDEDDSATAWTADESTAITLNGTSATVDGSGAEAKDGSVTITAAGTYVLSGELSDGQVVVNNQDDGLVRLVLNGVDIHDNDSAGIYIQEAGKVVMTLEEGTENKVSDGATYVFADDTTDEPSAAIFSKADLTINGTGKLEVEANYNDGIVSKDDLKVMSGTYEVQAADDGIVGKDMIAVATGDFVINAAGDGMKSSNDEDTSKGFIAIADGTYDITAGNDGIQAETSLLIDNGSYNMVTGEGSENGEVKMGGDPGDRRGMGGNRPSEPGGKAKKSGTNGTTGAATETEATEPTEATGATEVTTEVTTETESTSAKALKAGGDITVHAGNFTIDSADDAVHSNSSVSIMDGQFQIASGDDGIHADSLVAISGGAIDITKSYEGIEGANISISGGVSHVVASDDGVNVAGGNDDTSTEDTHRQDKFNSTGDHLLTISGGTLTVDASGDGLDANGSISMSGGTVIVNGPTNNGNGSLDFDGSFEQNGGVLITAGSSGMAQAPSDNSSQYSVNMTFSQTQQAGTLVHLEDSDGNEVLTFAPSKDYQSVLISSPDLKEGGSYTLYSGGSSTGSEMNGLYTDGEYSGGTEVVSFTLSSNVTWVNESGVTAGRMNQGPGGGGGNRGTEKNAN